MDLWSRLMGRQVEMPAAGVACASIATQLQSLPKRRVTLPSQGDREAGVCVLSPLCNAAFGLMLPTWHTFAYTAKP